MKVVAGQTILAWVLRRCQLISKADIVCCATVDTPDCDPITKEAERLGVMVFRGNEADVLSRYHGAAVAASADIIMRVTSDCPVIDPDVCDSVLNLLERTGADYACNNMPTSWPHGLDCEAFSMRSLESSIALAVEPEDKEHVTLVLRRLSQFKTACLLGPAGDWERLRWTLDTPEDFKFFSKFLTRIDPVKARFPAIAETLLADQRLLASCMEARPELRVTDKADVLESYRFNDALPSLRAHLV